MKLLIFDPQKMTVLYGTTLHIFVQVKGEVRVSWEGLETPTEFDMRTVSSSKMSLYLLGFQANLSSGDPGSIYQV